MPKTVTPIQITDDPQVHEDRHVHAVYDQIASHFSSTRHKVSLLIEAHVAQVNIFFLCKPWPIIADFLSTIPIGSVGLDAGTGNGKYLPLPLSRPPGSVYTIGLDRSRNLLQIARTAGADADETFKTKWTPREVVWGDVTGKGWRDGAFVCVFRFLMSICAQLCLLKSNRTTQYRSLQYIISPRASDGNRL
jgi:tRNA (uracil-5-)-methyltransferase TRM9